MVMTPEEQRMMGNAQASQPRSGLLGLFDKAMKTDDNTGLSPLQNFAAALDPLIMKDMRAGEGIRKQGAQRATSISKNKTVETLKKQGREDLAQLLLDGGINAGQAISMMQSEKAADTAFRRQQALAGGKSKDTALIRNAVAAGYKPGTPEFTRFIARGGDIYSQETALMQMLPKPESGMTYDFERDASGKILGYKLIPIPGGSVERELSTTESKKVARNETEQRKDLKFFSTGERALQMLDEYTGFIPLTGTAASAWAELPGVGQDQADMKEKLAVMEAQMQVNALQGLRDTSPNGSSGLGQLTNSERNAIGKIENNFSNLQGKAEVERAIKSALLLKSYFEGGLFDPSLNNGQGDFRVASDSEIKSMTDGINPFGDPNGSRLESEFKQFLPKYVAPQETAPVGLTTQQLMEKY